MHSLLSCMTFLFLSQYRYINLVQELHRVNLVELSQHEKLAFFLNLYNAMVIHAVIRVGHPEGMIDRRSFFNEFQYLVGGYPYSLNTIQNGILRNNSRAPYSLTKPFSSGDQRLQVNKLLHNFYLHFNSIKRGVWNCKVANLNQYFFLKRKSVFLTTKYILLRDQSAATCLYASVLNVRLLMLFQQKFQLALGKVNPLIHFGLCCGTRSSPTVRFFTPQGVEAELRSAAREYFQSYGMEVDLEKRAVHLDKTIKWWAIML